MIPNFAYKVPYSNPMAQLPNGVARILNTTRIGSWVQDALLSGHKAFCPFYLVKQIGSKQTDVILEKDKPVCFKNF